MTILEIYRQESKLSVFENPKISKRLPVNKYFILLYPNDYTN